MSAVPAPVPPPVSLYVHIPWCVRKCPYCDFNSHVAGGDLPEKDYLDALQRDFDADRSLLAGRQVESVFFGGGTPSLFAPETIAAVLASLRDRALLAAAAEITLEANPGTAEATRFQGYRDAGINRLSIGVQSFQNAQLHAIGRIHDGSNARVAIELALQAGFDNLNIDLMYGLPEQSPRGLLDDIQTALQYHPAHLSWYQLTIEPNTVFYRHTPALPATETIDDAWQEGCALLQQAGYQRYEISAWSGPGKECRHNLNYWQFGDYLGIGAGAHGKITTAGTIQRSRKPRQPEAYLQARFPTAGNVAEVALSERPREFLMNQLRLFRPFQENVFEARTGLPASVLDDFLGHARARGLMEADCLQPTATGYRFLDDLLTMI